VVTESDASFLDLHDTCEQLCRRPRLTIQQDHQFSGEWVVRTLGNHGLAFPSPNSIPDLHILVEHAANKIFQDRDAFTGLPRKSTMSALYFCTSAMMFPTSAGLN
jgi:hypothetical protein